MTAPEARDRLFLFAQTHFADKAKARVEFDKFLAKEPSHKLSAVHVWQKVFDEDLDGG